MTAVGEDEYTATMKVGIAMIKGTLHGKVEDSDKIEPSSYRMEVEGSGTAGPGFRCWDAELTETDGMTTVKYNGDANIRGTIARTARMIQPAARQIVGLVFLLFRIES